MNKPNKSVSLRKMKWMLFLLGVFKIPLVGFVKPRLVTVNGKTVQVKIQLRRHTKNHLNSMYFGALAVGADIAGGIHAFYFAELSESKVSFAFKSMKVEFIKRAESEILFESNEGELVKAAMDQSKITGERINQFIQVRATDKNGELVATFEMEVSVKVK